MVPMNRNLPFIEEVMARASNASCKSSEVDTPITSVHGD